MDYPKFYSAYMQGLAADYPSLAAEPHKLQIQHIVSPHELTLSKKILATVKQAVYALFEVSRSSGYQGAIKSFDDAIMLTPAKNHAVLMAYDFHVDVQAERASLIEINTNASGFLFAEKLYDEPAVASLHDAFANEAQLAGTTLKEIAIIDEDIPQQKMYPEFLMFRDLLGRWGWPTQIVDFAQLSASGPQFVYNRFNDFTFREARSAHLRQMYLKGEKVFSPHPKEYILLADKERLVELSQPGWLEKIGATPEQIKNIRSVLLTTKTVKDFASREEIWKARKQLFFKPKRSYGGKSSYKGSSISRVVFERLVDDDPIIQEFSPPPLTEFSHHSESNLKWKYDLRFYAYQGQVQLAVARMYQGQVTNFSSPYGGFVKINWK